MKSKNLAPVAALALALAFALTACEEKKTEGGSTFTDSRDGKAYKTVKIGSQTWMAENLNYKPSSGESWCYDNKESNCDKYGRLYDWETAMKACPSGWHLPEKTEWDILIVKAGGNDVAGKKLKAKSGWNDDYNGKSGNGTDDFGFSALPGSYRFYDDGTAFVTAGGSGQWWSSSVVDMDESNVVLDAVCFGTTDGIMWITPQRFGNSVRCVQGEAVAAKAPAAAESGGKKNMEWSTTVEFNNEKIPIKSFYSVPHPEEELASAYLDSLVFVYNGIKQTVSHIGTENYIFLDRHVMDSGDYPSDFSIRAGDFNFDNYMDIAVNVMCGGESTGEDFFIYNPQTKSYYYDKELSSMCGVSFDDETKTVSVLSCEEEIGCKRNEYKWSNGKLLFVKTGEEP